MAENFMVDRKKLAMVWKHVKKGIVSRVFFVKHRGKKLKDKTRKYPLHMYVLGPTERLSNLTSDYAKGWNVFYPRSDGGACEATNAMHLLKEITATAAKTITEGQTDFNFKYIMKMLVK